MIECRGYSGRPAASLRWSSRSSPLGIVADGMLAPTAARTAARLESAAGVGTDTAARTATTTVEFTAAMRCAGPAATVGVATPMRAAAPGTGVRTSSAMLSEYLVGCRSECERNDGCKQEDSEREINHFIFLRPTGTYLVNFRSQLAKQKENRFRPNFQRMHMGGLKL
jgi:hypothetical protein